MKALIIGNGIMAHDAYALIDDPAYTVITCNHYRKGADIIAFAQGGGHYDLADKNINQVTSVWVFGKSEGMQTIVPALKGKTEDLQKIRSVAGRGLDAQMNPSTGFNAIANAYDKGYDITLAGFDFYSQVPYKIGSHVWSEERKIINGLAEEGVLIKIDIANLKRAWACYTYFLWFLKPAIEKASIKKGIPKRFTIKVARKTKMILEKLNFWNCCEWEGLLENGRLVADDLFWLNGDRDEPCK